MRYELSSPGGSTPRLQPAFHSYMIVVVPYNPIWPSLFDAEKTLILSVLAPLEVTIEHIGSTAVSGLYAKPVIDVMIGVHFAEFTEVHIESLRLIGYGYVRARRGTLCLYKGHPRSHFIHIVERGGTEWQNKLIFRDYLRANPDAAKRYASLKNELITERSSSALYALGKRKHIVELLAQAKIWHRREKKRDQLNCDH
jgi:GrpB-like predicted nucleotidyltransferase (UPF0157 family)